MASRRSILSSRYNRFSSSSLLALMARLDRPLRDHLWQGPPVTRNAEIHPGDNDPPPKITQREMPPPTPPSSPSTASSSAVASCVHPNPYYSLCSLFSSLFP